MTTAQFDVSDDEELQIRPMMGLDRAPQSPRQTPRVEENGAPTVFHFPTTPLIEAASHGERQTTGGIFNHMFKFMWPPSDPNIIRPKLSRESIHKGALIVKDIPDSQQGDCDKFMRSAIETDMRSRCPGDCLGQTVQKGAHEDISYLEKFGDSSKFTTESEISSMLSRLSFSEGTESKCNDKNISDSQFGVCSNTANSPLNTVEGQAMEDTLIADLERRAVSFGADVLKLRRTLEKSREKITTMSSHIRDNENEIASLREKEQKLCESMESQVAKVVDYEKTISDLKTELRRSHEDMSRMQIAGENMALDFRKDTDSFSTEKIKLCEQLENVRMESSNKDVSIKRMHECSQMQARKMENAYSALDVKHTNIEQQLKSATEDLKMKKLEIQNMEVHISKMQQAYKKVENKNSKIEQQLSEMLAGRDGSYADGLPTPYVLESKAKELFSSIGRFCKLYSDHIKATRDVIPHRYNIFDKKVLRSPFHLARQAHLTFVAKSWVSRVLFHNFEAEGFDGRQDSRPAFQGDEERVRICSGYFQKSSNRNDTSRLDSLFEGYLKSRMAKMMIAADLNPLMESFNANSERVKGQSAADDLKLNLLQSLVTAARKTWDFHKLCLSFKDPATILRVKKDDAYDASYMDCSVGLDEDPAFVPKVGFMVFPGFRLRKSVVKCEVYFGTDEVMRIKT